MALMTPATKQNPFVQQHEQFYIARKWRAGRYTLVHHIALLLTSETNETVSHRGSVVQL